MNHEALCRFLRLSTEEQSSRPAGEWERRISVDTQIVAQSTCSALGKIASTLIAFSLVSLVIVCQQPIFLVLTAVLALSFLSIYQINAPQLINSARKARTTNYEEGATLIDLLTTINHPFRIRRNLPERLSLVTQQMEEHVAEVGQNANACTSQIRAIMILGTSACLITSVALFLLGTLEIGAIVAYTMLIGQIAGQMGQLTFVIPTLARGAERAQALGLTFRHTPTPDTDETPDASPSKTQPPDEQQTQQH